MSEEDDRHHIFEMWLLHPADGPWPAASPQWDSHGEIPSVDPLCDAPTLFSCIISDVRREFTSEFIAPSLLLPSLETLFLLHNCPMEDLEVTVVNLVVLW
jgi:hypothetical protein